jgi:hypothetical protein
MKRETSTPAEYLKRLPAERRAALTKVRAAIRKQLPRGFVETMAFGMISYVVPLERYPDPYNGQPLMLAALASQKNHMAVYLLGVYASKDLRAWFEKAYAASGKKLDMGKSCVRFKTLDALALDVVAQAIGKLSVDAYVKLAQAAR